MDTHDIRNVPVTDDHGRLLGVVGEHGLARAYVHQQKIGQPALPPLPLDSLAGVLSARVVVKAREILGGRVIIALDSPDISRTKLTEKDIAVVGDNEPMQFRTDCIRYRSPNYLRQSPGGRSGDPARHRGEGSLDSRNKSRRIRSRDNGRPPLPAYMVMETDIPRLSLSDTIVRAKQTGVNSKFRSACIVEKDGTLHGIVTRTSLLSTFTNRLSSSTTTSSPRRWRGSMMQIFSRLSTITARRHLNIEAGEVFE